MKYIGYASFLILFVFIIYFHMNNVLNLKNYNDYTNKMTWSIDIYLDILIFLKNLNFLDLDPNIFHLTS
jgi:hypothetical protein